MDGAPHFLIHQYGKTMGVWYVDTCTLCGAQPGWACCCPGREITQTEVPTPKEWGLDEVPDDTTRAA